MHFIIAINTHLMERQILIIHNLKINFILLIITTQKKNNNLTFISTEIES